MKKDKVKIGVIGMGGRGRYFARQYDRHPGAELAAVCDPDPGALKPLRAVYGKRIGYHEDTEEFFSRPDMDSVIIASPDHAHRDNAVAAFRNGKNVFLEKPLAQSVEDSDDIIRAWAQAGTVLLVGLELRYCSLFKRMREITDEGKIGPIITGLAIDNVSVGGNYYYHDRQRKKDYTKSLILQKGVHTIDLLNWFMGGQPEQVFAQASLAYYGGDEPNDKRCGDCDKKENCPFFIPREKFVMDYGEPVRKDDFCVFAEEADVNDNSQVLIRYPGGKNAVYTECHFTPEYTREFEFIGYTGKMKAVYNNEGNFLIRNLYRHTDHIDEWRPAPFPGGHGGGDPIIQQTFLDWIREPERMDIEQIIAARNATCVAAAAEQSIESGMPVKIPPPPAIKP